MSDPLVELQARLGERYTVHREIARGGMATVYLATDTRHGRPVAIKIVDSALVDGPAIQRFLREIEIAARLAHPHIVPLYDSGELVLSDAGVGQPYYVMPFITGESLRDRVRRSGPLGFEEVARLLREVGSALDYAHRQGVIHRDIKPENILLAEGHAMVADFGIARAVAAAASGTTLTQLGMIVGTPTYMAPEQGVGDEVDGRTDQYSLACVAFELLTGEPPFRGANAMAVLAQHITAAVPAASQLAPGVEIALHRALAKDPAKRFTTTSELADALTRHAPGAAAERDEVASRGRESVARQRLAQAGERRHATIVWTSIAGYERLIEQWSPDDAERLVGQIRGLAIECARNHGGLLNHFDAEGAMMLFGVPLAREDDALRGARAALDLHRAVRALSEAGLRMRSGIHTGVVVAQPLPSGDGTYRVTGVARDLANRLSQLAEPDAIVTSREFHRLVAPFVRSTLGPTVPASAGAPDARAFTLVSESDVHTRLEAAERTTRTPFAGRARELRTLNEQLTALRNGEGGATVIVGEAGTGKSRLLHEFRQYAASSQAELVIGRCDAYGGTTPYLPFVQVVRALLGLTADTARTIDERDLANRILALGAAVQEWIPVYFALLGRSSRTYALPRHMQGDQLQDGIRDGLVALIGQFARERPCAVLLEDWHWADEASRSALDQLLDAAVSTHLLIIVTCRPEAAIDWTAGEGRTIVNVGPLGLDATTEIICGLFGARRVTPPLAARLHERTGGNPFFLEETCQALKEQGDVTVEDGEAVPINDMRDFSLPETVQAVIRSRLDRLHPDAREVARMAAVIGREFSAPVLGELSGDPLELHRQLPVLQAAGLVQRIASAPEAVYRFKHVLTQEVAYDTLLEHQRRTLHSAVVRAIEHRYPDRLEEFLERLAHHSSRAGALVEAGRYAIRSADRSAGLSQFADALAMLDSAEDWVTQATDDERRHEVLVDMLFRQERLSESLGLRARQMTIVDRLITMLEPEGRSAQLAEAYLRRGDVCTLLRRFASAQAALDQSLRMSQEQGDRAGQRNALRSLALMHTHNDRHGDAEVAIRKAMTIDLEMGDTNAAAGDIITLGNVLRNLGRFDEAREALETALEYLSVEDDPPKWAMLVTLVGRVHRDQGDNAKALEWLERALQAAVEHRVPLLVGFIMPGIATILLSQGRTEESLATYRRFVELSRRERHAEGLAQALRGLGEVLIALERFAEAVAPLQESGTLFEQLEDHDAQSQVWQRLATSCEHGGNVGQARDLWVKLRQRYATAGDTPGESAAAEGIGRAARKTGMRELAMESFRDAAELALESNDERRAAALYNVIGSLHWEAGQLDGALASYQRALELSRTVGDRVHEGLLLNALGATLVALQRFEDATRVLSAAVTTNADTGERRLESYAHATLGDALLARRDYNAARLCYDRSLALRLGLGDRLGEGWMHERLARTWWAERRSGNARSAADVAASIAAEVRDPALMNAVNAILAEINP